MRKTLLTLCGLVIGTLVPAAAPALCTYTPLTGGVTVTTTDSLQAFSFNQTVGFWSGVALRSDPAGDWNLSLYRIPGSPPACVDTLLGSSARASGVDLVVGDFNSGHDTLGIYYPLATRSAGAADGTLEWDDGSNSLVVGGPLVNRTTDATDVIEMWDVFLVAGTAYRFVFQPVGASLSLLLFRSGAGPYWANRDSALFDVTSSTDITPEQTGYYGVAVVNDDGASGSYALGVGTCTPPVVLTSGVSVSTAGFAERTYQIEQHHVFWSVVGARGTSDWNVEAYASAGGTSYPTCLSDPLVGSSLAPPTVDFVAGDFNRTLVGTFYARVFLDQDQGSGSARVEWDDGVDGIFVDGDPSSGTMNSSDVLDAWDVYLTAGLTYYIRFNTTGADLRMLLMPPVALWEGRSAALFERTGDSTYVPYVATQTGWHGVVVVNENGGTGSYDIQFIQSLVGVAHEPPLVTGLQGVFPNPIMGSARIGFTLRESASMTLDVLDPSGRLVARKGPSTWEPGRWSIPWSGLDRGHRKLAPGIYFLRMSVSGHMAGVRKFIVLD